MPKSKNIKFHIASFSNLQAWSGETIYFRMDCLILGKFWIPELGGFEKPSPSLLWLRKLNEALKTLKFYKFQGSLD